MLHHMLRAAAGNAGKDLFIDKFGTPAFAYSLRKLSSSYSGNCIRVRRSSDNAEQDIGFSAGELDITSLLSFVGVNDGRVVTWYDQSGNSNHATEATAAYQPLIVISGSLYTNSTNGLPALRYAGPSMYGLDTGLTGYAQKTFIAIADTSPGGGGASRRIMSSYSGSGGIGDTYLLDYNSSSVRLWDGSPGVSRTVSAGLSLLYTYRTASLIGLAVNGGTAATASVGANTNPNTLKLFEEGGSNLSESPLSMQEAILYVTDESADRAGFESDVNDYYGVY